MTVPLFSIKKGGAGYARNIGVKRASGKWLIFADADDFFIKYFNDILNRYKESSADIIFFKACSLDSEYYSPGNHADHLNHWIDMYLIDKIQAERELRFSFGEPWCKFIQRELIIKNQILFDEIPVHNDTRFSYLTGYFAQNILIDLHAIYCVTVRNDSVSVSQSEEKKKVRIWVFGRAGLFFRLHNIPVKVTEHFNQLYHSLKENRETYLDGLKILNKLGYKNIDIYVGILHIVFIRRKRSIFAWLVSIEKKIFQD